MVIEIVHGVISAWTIMYRPYARFLFPAIVCDQYDAV